MKKLIALAFFAALAGCATSYQAKSFSGGFSETQLDKNVFRVSFQGNGYTCIDPVNSCSGVNVEGNDDEHPDGRRHQALDSQA